MKCINNISVFEIYCRKIEIRVCEFLKGFDRLFIIQLKIINYFSFQKQKYYSILNVREKLLKIKEKKRFIRYPYSHVFHIQIIVRYTDDRSR